MLNCADPDAPSGLDIARTVGRQLGHDVEEVLLDRPPLGTAGRHPWDRPYPVVLDTSAALALGWVPAGDDAATVAAEVEWLVRAARDGVLHPDGDYFGPMLDHGTEDRYLAGRPGSNATLSTGSHGPPR